MIDWAFSVVAGVCGLLALPLGVALLKSGERFEVSQRTLVAAAVILACAWCIGHAVNGQSTGPEALMMMLAAYQALSALRGRRILRRASDLNPFGGDHAHSAFTGRGTERAGIRVVGDGRGSGLRSVAAGARVRAGSGHR